MHGELVSSGALTLCGKRPSLDWSLGWLSCGAPSSINMTPYHISKACLRANMEHASAPWLAKAIEVCDVLTGDTSAQAQ